MTDSVHLLSNKHFEFVMAMLGRQRLNQRYCDVTLVVEDQSFLAHQAILAASSKYFDTMFYSQMREQFKNKIQIKEVTKAAMTQVINFIYTNQVSLSSDNFYEVLHAASLMQLEDLLELIIKYLHGAITPKSCLHYRQIGKLYSLHDLVAKCDECIQENFDEVSVQKKFLEIEVDAMGKFMASDELMVKSEEGVYKILVAWIKHDLQCRKKYFPNLFNHLRLQYVCLDYLSKTIRKEELVREFLVREFNMFIKLVCLALVCCSKVNIYNTVNKTWTSGNSMIEAGASCAAVFVDGKIFAFGGFGENKAPLLSAEFMNIADGVWTMLKTNIPYQLGEATACCVGDYIAMYGSSTPGHVALYNIRNGQWKTFKEEGQNLFTGKGCLMAT
uniref:kelch-like protein 2 isoform X2 n=1 Tax=Ciona intestinalis TaxID=7719 RepID=UPI000EF545EA|nr:kelch-like protein 2 isoform X2 [Ciona intestinalis]|eukprot:XP_026692475.1 kelch-like protein 2 isoform X2 [Ciona intestinalis]